MAAPSEDKVEREEQWDRWRLHSRSRHGGNGGGAIGGGYVGGAVRDVTVVG